MSAAGRKAISEAAKKRWAAFHAAKTAPVAAKKATAKRAAAKKAPVKTAKKTAREEVEEEGGEGSGSGGNGDCLIGRWTRAISEDFPLLLDGAEGIVPFTIPTVSSWFLLGASGTGKTIQLFEPGLDVFLRI
jgi:hypothetical protein